MLMLKTRPAAKGRRNMKARLEPFSRSLCRTRGSGWLVPVATAAATQGRQPRGLRVHGVCARVQGV